MLSHKQGIYLARLLPVGTCCVLHVLVSAFVAALALALAATAQEFGHNMWAPLLLYAAVLCDTAWTVSLLILGVRALKGRLPVVRFCVVSAISVIGFLLFNYVSLLVANLLSDVVLSLM